MTTVYLLWHTHQFQDGADDEKLIGVYVSEPAAHEAQKRICAKPRFVDHPDGFEIIAYEIGKDHWTEGFVRA